MSTLQIDTNPLQIIILDDHPMIIDGIRLLLDGVSRFQLAGQAASVPELITLLGQPADLLILDLNVKGKNIIADVARIRERAPGLKILVFSSYNTPSLVRRAFEQQVDGYLLKDTTQDELLDALDAIGAGQRFIGPNVNVPKKGLAMKITAPELVDDFEKRFNLTERETDIIRLMAKGHDSKAIATELFISLHTVQTHRKNIMRKLDLHSAVDIARWALQNGLG